MLRVLATISVVALGACGGSDAATGPGDQPSSTPGAVSFTVTDRFGGLVAGARVDLIKAGAIVGSVTTGADGLASFTGVSPGSYGAQAAKPGFVRATAELTVASGQTFSWTLRLNPESLPVGGVSATRIISGLGTPTLNFETDIFVVDQASVFVSGLSSSAFSIASFSSDGATVSFSLQAASQINDVSRGPFSAALLLDQSGSIASTDPNSSRLQAAKTFLSALGGGDNVVLSAFAGSGRLISFETTLYGNGFTSNGASYFGTLDQLATQVGGTTPLYKSTYAMTDYVAKNATNANKAVVVFTDGQDTEGGVSPAQLYAFAKSNGVRIFTVALGTSSSVDIPILQDVANQTGGAMVMANDARQLVAAYGTFGKVLHGEAALYRLRWSSSRSAGSWNRPGYVFSSLRVALPQGEVFVPFAVNF